MDDAAGAIPGLSSPTVRHTNRLRSIAAASALRTLADASWVLTAENVTRSVLDEETANDDAVDKLEIL